MPSTNQTNTIASVKLLSLLLDASFPAGMTAFRRKIGGALA